MNAVKQRDVFMFIQVLWMVCDAKYVILLSSNDERKPQKKQNF